MPKSKPRIVVVGAGIAGSLIASGLGRRTDLDLICLEKVDSAGHADAGTGLNIGPNAIKALRSVMPERAEAIVANSLAWRRWTIGLTGDAPYSTSTSPTSPTILASASVGRSSIRFCVRPLAKPSFMPRILQAAAAGTTRSSFATRAAGRLPKRRSPTSSC